MRNLALVLAAAALVIGTACAKKSLPPPPAPPAVPAEPPPAPPPSTPAPAPEPDEYTRLRSMSPAEIDGLNLFKDIHFDYDRSDIRDDARPVLAANAQVLRRFDFLQVTLEGHCDERGTVDYNLALGERRARATSEYLVSLGIPAGRLRTVSYGKEAPLCSEETEDCWARNRRGKVRVSGVVDPR